MAMLIIPEETKIIPEQEVDVDLYEELKKPMYFCPGIGGVVRDVKWIAEQLERSAISFTPGELVVVLGKMVRNDLIRMIGGRNSADNWHIAFTLDRYEPFMIKAKYQNKTLRT